MTQPHDSQVGWQVLKRNLENLSIITADKGYDWWLLRNRLRAEVVKRPIAFDYKPQVIRVGSEGLCVKFALNVIQIR